MAVPEQTPFIEYTANGTTTVFPLPFQCDKAEYLIVNLDGNEAPVGSWSFVNGSVTFNTAPANGVVVNIERNTPFQRTTDYQSYNNSFRPAPVNKDFDLIWWKLQELGYRDQVIWLALVKEISGRIDGDENLQNQINTIDEWLDNLQQNVDENTRDIAQLVNDLSKEIADRITGDKILKDMFLSMIDEAINEGTINALAITHLDSLEALEGVTNVWDGRTIYVKDLGNYRYDALTTSWVKAYQDADNVKDGSESQMQINDKSVRVFESIADLLTYTPRKDGQVVYVKGYHNPTNFALAKPYVGGGHRVYVASRAAENDGFLCINGWVLQHENVFTPYHSGCKCDGVTDDTLNFDKLMYALERNNLKGHVIINDPMFFNSQCPRIGKLIDPVQFNEKNAIRLVSNVKLEINSTLTFGSFFAGSSGQPKCNILSGMYRADSDDWYGRNRHENIEVFGTGTLDFTATESESAVQDGYRWIIKASVKNMKIHGLKFQGGDFANAVQTSKTSENIEIYDNKFINLMSNKSKFHDHSTIYCIGKDIKVHDNVFVFTNVKGRLNACACELHGSEQWFYNNKVFGYPNLVFSAILRTDQSLDENEVVYDQKVFGNTANISRSALGYWSILGKTAKLNDLTFNNNIINFIEPPTLEEFNEANVNGMTYPSSLPASIFTVWHEGDSVPNITYAAEVLQGIYIHDNIQTAVDGLLQSQDVSLIRFVGCYIRENLKIFNNSFKLNRLLNRDVSTSTTSDYFSGWYIKNNTYDFSKHKSVIYSFTMYLEYMKNCVFDFALDSNFPVIDKTYNFLYFVFADRSKVKDNVIKIDVEKSYDALDAWFGGSMMTYTRAEMRTQNNSIESISYCYIKESRIASTTVATMQIVTNNIPLSVQSGFIKRYMDEMIGSIYYPSSYTLDYSGGSKLKAVAASASIFPESTKSDRNAYIKFIC